MKLVVVEIIFEVLLVPNKRVFRIQVNYVTLDRQPQRGRYLRLLRGMERDIVF